MLALSGDVDAVVPTVSLMLAGLTRYGDGLATGPPEGHASAVRGRAARPGRGLREAYSPVCSDRTKTSLKLVPYSPDGPCTDS